MTPLATIIEGAILRFGADVAGEVLPLGRDLVTLIRHKHALDQAPDDDPRRQVLVGNVAVAEEIVMERFARIEGMLGKATGQPLIAAVLGALAASKDTEGGEG